MPENKVITPYNPERWSLEEQTYLALGSISVVEELLRVGGHIEGNVENGAALLLRCASEFLDFLDLPRVAMEREKLTPAQRPTEGAPHTPGDESETG